MKKKTHYTIYNPRTIVNTAKRSDDGWFWTKYSVYPYIGCEWGCEYCYWRDQKYNPHKPERDPEVAQYEDPFSQYIKVKQDAPEKLLKALKNKPRDLICIYGYQPVNDEFHYARKMLEVCLMLKFPVFIIEKSPMLLKDLDLFRQISKETYMNVGWSIITGFEDETFRMFEPYSPGVNSRFTAMKILSENGIFTGTILMPILPFIYDDERNIREVIKRTKESGGRYILDGGLTLWGECGTRFYKALEKHKPELIAPYKKLYDDSSGYSSYYAGIHDIVVKYCREYNIPYYIPRPVNHYPKEIRLNKHISGRLHTRARELQISCGDKNIEWAYRKAGRALNDLEKNIGDIYREQGVDGIAGIEGINKDTARRIAAYLGKTI